MSFKITRTFFIIKSVILLLTLFFLFKQFQAEINGGQGNSTYNRLIELIHFPNLLYLVVAILLMPLNYLLEAVKWRKVIHKIEKLSLLTTLKSVFAGLSVGFITPNNIGDYAGRLSFLKKENRIASIPLLFISRVIQMLITSWAGGLALFYFLNKNLFNLGPVGFIFIVLFLSSGTFAVFLLHKLPVSIPQNNLINKLFTFLLPLKQLDVHRLFFLCMISVLRHIVFILQFYLVFHALGSYVTVYQVFLGTSAALLVKSVLPGFKALNDLGIREAASIYFYHHFSESSLLVAGVCLIIWIVNMVLPALTGLTVIMLRKTSSINLC